MFTISAKIDISSLKFDPEAPVKGQQVSMTVRLENVGEGEARFVKARLEGLEGSREARSFSWAVWKRTMMLLQSLLLSLRKQENRQ